MCTHKPEFNNYFPVQKNGPAASVPRLTLDILSYSQSNLKFKILSISWPIIFVL